MADTKRGITLWCPHEENYKSHFVCVYSCPTLRMRRCPSYRKHYDKIIERGIPEFYVEKYGQPALPPPYALTPQNKPKLCPGAANHRKGT